MNLHAAMQELIESYGTHEGVMKEWDERGRGRHPASGGQKTEDAKQIEEVDYEKRITDAESQVREVAKAFGISEDRIVFTPEDKSFTVGDRQFEEAAHANLKTGEITFRIGSIADMEEQELRGITVHEVEHLKFAASEKAYFEERGKLEKLQGKIYDETMNGNPKAMPVDAYIPLNYPTFLSGALKEEFKHQFPLVARFEPTAGGEHFLEMCDKDGVSDYSKAYWDGWKTGNIPSEIAFHETVAEIARLKATDPNMYAMKTDPLWKDYVKAVN